MIRLVCPITFEPLKRAVIKLLLKGLKVKKKGRVIWVFQAFFRLINCIYPRFKPSQLHRRGSFSHTVNDHNGAHSVVQIDKTQAKLWEHSEKQLTSQIQKQAANTQGTTIFRNTASHRDDSRNSFQGTLIGDRVDLLVVAMVCDPLFKLAVHKWKWKMNRKSKKNNSVSYFLLPSSTQKSSYSLYV